VIAPEYLANAIRKMHDFLTVGAPHPLQQAGVVALQLGQEYYRQLVEQYDDKRKLFSGLLRKAGFQCYIPEGAYYIMTDISNFGFSDDTEFAHWLVKEIGVGGVPGSSFYSRPELGKTKLRFMFSKDEATLRQAADRLMRIGEKI
jgi:aminotransferase